MPLLIFREFLLESLILMLTTDLRFCQSENVEQHIWKLAFHNVIEALRKAMSEEVEAKEDYRVLLIKVIDEVNSFFSLFLSLFNGSLPFTYFLLANFCYKKRFAPIIGIVKVNPLDIHYLCYLTFFERPSAIHYEQFIYLNILIKELVYGSQIDTCLTN